MRKILTFLVTMFIILTTYSFAIEEGVPYSEEADDDVISIDDYDDFYSAYGGEGTQDEMKEYYREYLSYSREQDKLTKPIETIKAKVIDVKNESITYGMDYYTPYKIKYQPIKVEILEGEYVGKIFDVQYILTADTYENMKISNVNVGDKIFVNLDTDDDGKVQAYTATYDSRIDRTPEILMILLVVALLIVVFGKLKGLKFLLLAVLIFDLVFVITVPSIMSNNKVVVLESNDSRFPSLEKIDADDKISILEVDDNNQPTKVEIVEKNAIPYFLMIIDVIVISAVCLINDIGLSKKTLVAFAVSACTLIFMIILAVGINLITGMTGNSFEAISSAESIVNKNIDFGAIYLFSILLIGSVAVPNVVSYSFQNEDVESVKNHLKNIMAIIIVFSAMIILPKSIVLSIYKYSNNDLMNSEILLLEISRVLVLIIGLILSTIACKKIIKNNDVINEEEKL